MTFNLLYQMLSDRYEVFGRNLKGVFLCRAFNRYMFYTSKNESEDLPTLYVKREKDPHYVDVLSDTFLKQLNNEDIMALKVSFSLLITLYKSVDEYERKQFFKKYRLVSDAIKSRYYIGEWGVFDMDSLNECISLEDSKESAEDMCNHLNEAKGKNNKYDSNRSGYSIRRITL